MASAAIAAAASMAYEMKGQMRREDRLTVVTKDPVYHFVPSNPWVPVRLAHAREPGDRSRADMARKEASPSRRARSRNSSPSRTCSNSPTVRRSKYDYLVIATGPELAFDEIEGLGPRGLHPIDLPHRSRREGGRSSRPSARIAGPDHHRRGAGRLVLRSGLRIHVHSSKPNSGGARSVTAFRSPSSRRALHRPSRPRRRRRHQGPSGKRDARAITSSG